MLHSFLQALVVQLWARYEKFSTLNEPKHLDELLLLAILD